MNLSSCVIYTWADNYNVSKTVTLQVPPFDTI